MYFDGAYGPFGEPYAESGTADLSFTGMNQDTVPNLFDFPAREYNDIHGRWPSPDPAGISAVRIRNPQTWNRYAYVNNSPLNHIDPSGLDPLDDIGMCPESVDCFLTGVDFGGDPVDPSCPDPTSCTPGDPNQPDPIEPEPTQNQCGGGVGVPQADGSCGAGPSLPSGCDPTTGCQQSQQIFPQNGQPGSLSSQQCSNLNSYENTAEVLAVAAAVSGAEPVALALEVAAIGYRLEATLGGCFQH